MKLKSNLKIISHLKKLNSINIFFNYQIMPKYIKYAKKNFFNFDNPKNIFM